MKEVEIEKARVGYEFHLFLLALVRTIIIWSKILFEATLR